MRVGTTSLAGHSLLEYVCAKYLCMPRVVAALACWEDADRSIVVHVL